MIALLLRTALSGLIVAVVAIVARRNPVAGALIASLPLVSLLGMIWLWRDSNDAERVAAYSLATFCYVIPSLPMFLLIPWILRQGGSVAGAIGAGCMLTIILYLLTTVVAARFGVRL